MAKILVVSKTWPSDGKSGVSLASAQHVEMLIELGHQITILGSNALVLNEKLNVKDIRYIPASGSGSLYSPARVNISTIDDLLRNNFFDLIITEAWQTSLTDKFIDRGFFFKIPILMISHGVSLHPFNLSFLNIVRSLGWLYYSIFILPKLMKKLSAITTLDMHSNSSRFFDRKLALKNSIPVIEVVNSPIHIFHKYIQRKNRKNQVLIVGYFSPIKNQLFALKILRNLHPDINFKFIGNKSGDYFESCLSYVNKHSLQNRTIFLSDSECDLAEEIASSLMILSVSITEALSIVLVEAMANGTPFVATPVGAVESMGAGILCSNLNEFMQSISSLTINSDMWESYSKLGVIECSNKFTYTRVKASLQSAVEIALNKI